MTSSPKQVLVIGKSGQLALSLAAVARPGGSNKLPAPIVRSKSSSIFSTLKYRHCLGRQTLRQ